MTGLAIEDIGVSYDGAPALRDFSLQVPTGEIMAVVGPSGSGKSTLLRAIAGLEPLTAGRIVLDGTDLAGVPTHKRNLGLMFQDHGLFGHLSVADNIGYGLKTAGVDRHRRETRVGQLLELVDLQGFGRRGTGELSGGEAQRVALARALAPEPGLLMLDEPLGSLDRALRDQLTGDLRRLLNGLGQTALHVSHDQAEAFALADRVAIIKDGRLVAVGAPAELWADPGSRFVAEFLGHPNIWSVSLADDGRVRWNGLELGAVGPEHQLRADRPDGSIGPDGPGRRTVVVPATGLREALPGEPRPTLTVTVTEVVFRAGLHDVTATADNTADGGAGNTAGNTTGATVEFTTANPVRPGQSLQLTVDLDLVRPLDGRE